MHWAEGHHLATPFIQLAVLTGSIWPAFAASRRLPWLAVLAARTRFINRLQNWRSTFQTEVYLKDEETGHPRGMLNAQGSVSGMGRTNQESQISTRYEAADDTQKLMSIHLS